MYCNFIVWFPSDGSSSIPEQLEVNNYAYKTSEVNSFNVNPFLVMYRYM